jgi:hypothetical protein
MKIIEPLAPRRGSPVPVVPDYPARTFILAIDPGENTGWALFDWPATQRPACLVACGIGHPPFGVAKKVFIEMPQFYPRGHKRPNDLIKLAFTAGRLVGASGVAEMGYGYEATYFLPHEWKGNIPKETCNNRARMRLQPDELAVLAACENVILAYGGGGKSVLHNVLDAIGIGLFAVGRF